jgi:hypothetical protein
VSTVGAGLLAVIDYRVLIALTIAALLVGGAFALAARRDA